MNRKSFALSLIVLIILQTTFISNWEIFGVSLNLFLVYTLVISVLYGSEYAAYTGLGLGLLEDVMFSNVLGIRALIYFLIGSFVGRVLQNNEKNVLTGALMAFIAGLFAAIGQQIFIILLRIPFTGWKAWFFRLPILALMNSLAYVALLFILRRWLKPKSLSIFTGLGK